MEHKAINTHKLYDETHAALLAGNLVTARAALDELPPNDYGQLIRDRIELVNAKVENRR